MSLCVKKLKQLLININIVPLYFYCKNEICYFIQCSSTNYPIIFFITIPSKYDFKMKITDKNVIEIKTVDLEVLNNQEIINESINHVNYIENNLKKKLAKIDYNIDIEEELEKGYTTEIFNTKEDIYEIKSIIKQLDRFSLCTKDTPYYFFIAYKEFINFKNKYGDNLSYSIKNKDKLEIDDIKKIYVSFSIEHMYANSNNIINDIRNLEIGISSIIGKNQVSHHDNIKNILKNVNFSQKLLSPILESKEKYDDMINKYEKNFNEYCEKESKINQKYLSLKKEEEDYKGIVKDTSFLFKKQELKTDLVNISKKKFDIVNTIVNLKENRNNLLLVLDSVIFDNIIYCDKINKNLQLLKNTYENLKMSEINNL